GGLAWINLARLLNAPHSCAIALASAYPWLPFVSSVYHSYLNDYLAIALAPWICWAILQIEPLKASDTAQERWGRLILAAALAGGAMLVKYSLAPLLAAAIAYLLWLDGKDSSRRRGLRMAVFS